MYEIIESMKKYSEMLNYAYAKATTKSQKRKVASALFRFSLMCHSKELIFEKFDWENNEELKDLLDNDASILRRNILLNKETYLKNI